MFTAFEPLLVLYRDSLWNIVCKTYARPDLLKSSFPKIPF